MIRKNIQTRELANGAQLSIPIFCFSGSEKKAPSVYIQSCVHGSEVQGYLVTLQLIEHFSKNPPKGDVTIVPLANPDGLNCKIGEYTLGRFDPVTGNNWNRNYIDQSTLVDSFLGENKNLSFEKLLPVFRSEIKEKLEQKLNATTSYHKKLALQLQNLAVSADIVLDLHCDRISVPHIYSPTYAMSYAIHLGIPFIIEIPHTFAGALDEAIFCPWVKLTEKYNELYSTQMNVPTEAFTIELGKQENVDNKIALEQTNGILNYLSIKDVLERREVAKKATIYSCKLEDFTTIHAPFGGLIVNHAPPGKILHTNKSLISLNIPDLWNKLDNTDDLIADSNKEIQIDCDAIPIVRATSPIVHEGMILMKVMTRYRKIF